MPDLGGIVYEKRNQPSNQPAAASPFMHTGLRSAVSRHFIGSLARVQIRGASRTVEWGDRPPSMLNRIDLAGTQDGGGMARFEF
jgi:hypothetical protein